ncbi:RDD family protein [Flavobacterium sp. RSB2_4_14]|uniref:RDD family protein n=1 Tax=Flavobacterium sp. RSB2_4_14 TaxID=3447665 RepID=UPI003F36D96F
MQANNRKQFQVSSEIFASHGQRFTNLLVDTIMQLILFFIVLVFMSANAQANGDKAFIANLEKNTILQYTITMVISLFYYNVFEIASARTVGKYITQTIVVDENGEKPNSETILVRSLCRLIPFNAFSFLGISGRGWHDTISKTYVVNKKLLAEKKRLFDVLEQNQNEAEHD